jgi:hypothetical protein
MLSPLAALRAGRSHTRYVQAPVADGDRRWALPRRSRLAPTARVSGPHPLAELRTAARSLTRPAARTAPISLAIRRSTRVTWTRRTVDGLRAAREGSAAAWRA